MTKSASHASEIAALVSEHREQLKRYANSDEETAWLAQALLEWDRADQEHKQEGI